jgi:hypothetical protein
VTADPCPGRARARRSDRAEADAGSCDSSSRERVRALVEHAGMLLVAGLHRLTALPLQERASHFPHESRALEMVKRRRYEAGHKPDRETYGPDP